MDIMELRISFWVLSLLCYDVKTSPQLAATLLVFFNCNFTMKYERNSYVNKRSSNEVHSHVGRRLHQVGDVLFEKMLSCRSDLMSSLPTSLPPDQKMFFKLAEILLIISFEKEKFLVLAVFRKTFSIGKKSNFNFQNRGYFVKKNIPQMCWNFGHK